MLFRSLVLMVFIQWLGITSAIKDDSAVLIRSEDELEALKGMTWRQRKAWGKPISGLGEKIKGAKEQVSRAYENSEGQLDKIKPISFSLQEIPIAAIEEGWPYFEMNTPGAIDGKNPSTDEGDASFTQQQNSVKTNGKIEDTPMHFRTDKRQDVEGTKTSGNDRTMHVKHKNDHEQTVQLSLTSEGISTSFPKHRRYRLNKSSRYREDRTKTKSYPSLKKHQSSSEENARMKGTISDRFGVKDRMQEAQRMKTDANKAGNKAEIFEEENGKKEERMRERERMVNFRMEGEKEGERIMTGRHGKMNERMREQGTLVGERMEGEREGERIVVRRQSKIKEKMNEQEKVEGDRREERAGERGVMGENRKMMERKYGAISGDKNYVVEGFEHQGETWLPEWFIKEKSKGKQEKRNVGTVLHNEMEKERELNGHAVAYI